MPLQTERVSLGYKNCSKKFTEEPADYTKQYCSIYLTRLRRMEEFLVERVQQKWGDRYPICKLHKLMEESYDKCVVIGTLFKDQKLKPSVLKQLAESNQLVPQPVLNHFTDQSDRLFMEDEVQRYQIIGNMDTSKLVTGITCALLGSECGTGKFSVDEYIFVGYRPQIEFPIFDSSVYVFLISGLNFIEYGKNAAKLQLLFYWLAGLLGDISRVSNVARVIIAGNSISNTPLKTKSTISMVSRVNVSQDTIEAVKSFDQFLTKLCQIVEVDTMPGEYDPSNHILPQKPMHYCMFPESSVYKSFNQVSNPYHCELDGFKLLGTSGQPVKDIMRFSEITDPLEAMEDCLVWNHLAPTAPDTLGCFPHYQSDPFILEDCPHVFFAGNQEKFTSKIVVGENQQKVCLISIPDFSTTGAGVLLNIQNLDCQPIVFETK